MKNVAITISLIACLCAAAACQKNDEPDLSIYTNKLAGNRMWKRTIFEAPPTGADPDTFYLNDTSMEVIVMDNEHIIFNGQNLSYKSFSGSELIYNWAPEGSDYSALLCYYHKLVSIAFYHDFNHFGGYSRSRYTTVN